MHQRLQSKSLGEMTEKPCNRKHREKMPFFTSRTSERISGNVHKIKDLKGAFSNAIETAEEKKKAFVFICLRSVRMKMR